MSLTYKKGDAVRQKVFVIEGTVKDAAIVDGEVQYCVEYVDAAGETNQRFFAEGEITAAGASTE